MYLNCEVIICFIINGLLIYLYNSSDISTYNELMISKQTDYELYIIIKKENVKINNKKCVI